MCRGCNDGGLNASNRIYVNRRRFRVALTFAILLPCARGGQKWLILGNNGKVTQGSHQNRPFLTHPSVHMQEGWQGSKQPWIMFSHWYSRDLKRFHDDSRVPGWPCHCDLILTTTTAIFDHTFAQGGGMAGVKTALNHVFLLVLMWFEVIKSFYNESLPQTDSAIVTCFWP